MTEELKAALEFAEISDRCCVEWQKLRLAVFPHRKPNENAEDAALRILGAEIRRLRTALAEIVETSDLEPEDPDCGCARCLAGRALKAGRL